MVPGAKGDVSDDDLRALADEAEKVGLDVPLGWPEAFVRAVSRHRNRDPWDSGGADPWEAEKAQLRYRRTDFAIIEATGIHPLSVSTDRIGVPALRIARALAIADRTGSGKIVEVYPAAALKVWHLPHQGYKGKAGASVRAGIVRDVKDRVQGWLDATEAEWDVFRASDDALDAFIAALVAKAHALVRCRPIPKADEPAAAREGWIALPTSDALEHLA